MDYCISDDIEIQIGKNSLVQLTNDDNTQQTVDSVVVEEALIYSSTLIDGYLRGKYNLPLNTQFPLLRVREANHSIKRNCNIYLCMV